MLAALDFTFLFKPLEALDARLTDLFHGAPLLVVVVIAAALGLRHASDPDHMVAVTTLMARDDTDARTATRLGVWWGFGHATMLLVLGVPLLVLKSHMPAWLETTAERTVGLVIVLLALRVIWRWARGRFAVPVRSDAHAHPHAHPHADVPVRGPAQAYGIGLLHGLAGTGGVVVLLLAALPTRLEAALALGVFAPMTVISMAACTTAFAWLLTRPLVEPVYRAVLIPGLGLFGLLFGVWYVGAG